MGIIVDAIIIVCLLMFMFVGYKRGLTGSLLKLVSFALAIVIAVLLYKPISNFIINNTQIDENMTQSIIDTFGKKQDTETENEKKETGSVESTIMDNISKDIQDATEETKNKVVESSAKNAALGVIKVGSAIIVFLIAKIILVIIGFFVKGISELPIIRQVDTLGGLLYGFAEGMIVIYIVLGIVSLVGILATNNIVLEAIQTSTLGSMLYNNNLIVKLLFK